jgi:hypothetical protein
LDKCCHVWTGRASKWAGSAAAACCCLSVCHDLRQRFHSAKLCTILLVRARLALRSCAACAVIAVVARVLLVLLVVVVDRNDGLVVTLFEKASCDVDHVPSVERFVLPVGTAVGALTATAADLLLGPTSFSGKVSWLLSLLVPPRTVVLIAMSSSSESFDEVVVVAIGGFGASIWLVLFVGVKDFAHEKLEQRRRSLVSEARRATSNNRTAGNVK